MVADGLRRAAGLSLLVHGVALGVLAAQVREPRPAVASEPGSAGSGEAASVAAEPTYVDLAVPVPPSEALPPEAELPAWSTLASVIGDETRLVAEQTAPQRGTTRDRAAPAPDTGAGAGRALPQAFRRDRSSLHARQSDGADVYQQSHERTSSRASSPQAIRQERVVGIGDSSRTRRPAPAEPGAPAAAPADADDDREPSTTLLANDAVPAAQGADLARGQGPLDADRGARRFDVEARGVARDDRSARAASNDSHPGRMDLSVAAAPGAGDSGRGPAEAPGATPRPSAGRAPIITGAAQDLERGRDVALNTTEREYQRFQAEIRRRVASVLRFPKRLALMLEQGETVVQFVVSADGRLQGSVKVVKSAGFAEFDQEAVAAVTRAAPYPPVGRALSVSMPIAFDNPVVR